MLTVGGEEPVILSTDSTVFDADSQAVSAPQWELDWRACYARCKGNPKCDDECDKLIPEWVNPSDVAEMKAKAKPVGHVPDSERRPNNNFDKPNWTVERMATGGGSDLGLDLGAEQGAPLSDTLSSLNDKLGFSKHYNPAFY